MNSFSYLFDMKLIENDVVINVDNVVANVVKTLNHIE